MSGLWLATTLAVAGAWAQAPLPPSHPPVGEVADEPSAEEAAAAPAPEEPAPEQATPAEVGGPSEPPAFAPPSAEEAAARSAALSRLLRCPVCQGLSVADSPADGARAMQKRIEELVAQGYADEQISDYFVDRYGTWVLLEPPAEGTHWLIYAGPAVGAASGLSFLLWFVGSRRRETPVDAPVAADDALAPYRARILAMLEGSA